MSNPEQTNWIVITGAPCAGKTTSVDQLREMGYETRSEPARAILETAIAEGKTPEEIRADPQKFIDEVLAVKQKEEAVADPQQLIVWDRGIPDGIAYAVRDGVEGDSVKKASAKRQYREVLAFEPLADYVVDGIRSESPEEALEIYELICECYEELGYTVTHVPAGTVEEQVTFVLKQVRNLEDDRSRK